MLPSRFRSFLVVSRMTSEFVSIVNASSLMPARCHARRLCLMGVRLVCVFCALFPVRLMGP